MTGGLRQVWGVAKALLNTDASRPALDEALAGLRAKVPAPVFWLFGRTQTGKTSIIKYLTGAEDAAIGSGFRPCTRTSRVYPFPTADAPLLTFLDTRGLDEPDYDPAEDIAAFDQQAHVLLVTAKITDLSQGNLREALRKVRAADRRRPVVLALTTLHEAYPFEQHPQPYPYADPANAAAIPPAVARLIDEHTRQFGDLVDAVVPIDFTRPEEGYDDPAYGGEHLKRTLLRFLPAAYRQSLLRLDEATRMLKDIHLTHAGPLIAGYASMAATAGAIPVPFVDLVLIPAVQSRMVYHIAKIYGQELSAARFLELAGSLGLGLLARQAVREVAKLIPFVGSAAGAAVAWASTYALGRAFCLYYEMVHQGHAPDPDAIKRFYREQFAEAERHWTPTPR
jgi:uncharacterized protein (DUF697 family)/predicted GTPase